MKKNQTKLLVLTAVFTAITAAFTAFVSFPVLGNGGYIHIGDSVILLGSAVLPTPYAIFVGAVGGALGDIILGSAIWAPFTLIIKALISLCISNKGEKILTVRNCIGFIPVFLITTVGYYLSEAAIVGNFTVPLESVLGNAVQAVGSIVIFTAAAFSFDKTGLKNKIYSELNK